MTQETDISVLLKRASWARDNGDLRQAHEILSKLVESNPREVEPRFRFAQLLRMLGHHDRSRAELKHVELDPSFANFAYFERFRLEEPQTRGGDDPIGHLMRSLVVTPTFLPSMVAAMKVSAVSLLRVSVAIGSAVGLDEHFNDAMRRGFNEEAARLLRSCLCLDPKSRVAIFWGSRIASSQEDKKISQNLAKWAAAGSSGDAQLQMLAASSSFKVGDFELAEVYTRRSIALAEDNAEAWFYLGRLLWLRNETNEAIDALAKAARREKSYAVRAKIVMAGIEPIDFAPNPPPL